MNKIYIIQWIELTKISPYCILTYVLRFKYKSCVIDEQCHKKKEHLIILGDQEGSINI